MYSADAKVQALTGKSTVKYTDVSATNSYIFHIL
jgi:hypothetical protein